MFAWLESTSVPYITANHKRMNIACFNILFNMQSALKKKEKNQQDATLSVPSDGSTLLYNTRTVNRARTEFPPQSTPGP